MNTTVKQLFKSNHHQTTSWAFRLLAVHWKHVRVLLCCCAARSYWPHLWWHGRQKGHQADHEG